MLITARTPEFVGTGTDGTTSGATVTVGARDEVDGDDDDNEEEDIEDGVVVASGLELVVCRVSVAVVAAETAGVRAAATAAVSASSSST